METCFQHIYKTYDGQCCPQKDEPPGPINIGRDKVGSSHILHACSGCHNKDDHYRQRYYSVLKILHIGSFTKS